jgi:Ca2+-binding RTX toxin-like protein
MRRLIHYLLVVAAFAAPPAAHAAVAQSAAHDLCHGHRGSGVRCQPGHGRRTRGGGHKVSHRGWPAVTGILWMAWAGTEGRTDSGTGRNDELLGLHGNDLISGGTGHDILWGDQFPTGNNTWQHDVIWGGPGKDWIYSSHGRNDIAAGPGNDHVWGHFGRGTIDCGSGWDVVHTKRHSTYKLRNCERHLHH